MEKQIIEIVALLSSLVATIYAIKYRRAAREGKDLRIRVGDLELEKELRENKDNADAHFDGRSADNILDESLSSKKMSE